jgi:hypothetical protein
MAQDTHRDLAACFAWKRVRLGFPSLASRLAEARSGDEAEDGRVDAMGCIRLFYPNFTVFIVLGHKDSLVISFPINRTLRVGGED